MKGIELKYRILESGLPPRSIKVPIPGWGGELQLPTDGSFPQPWHCQPFIEGAVCGFELLFPSEFEYSVETLDGSFVVSRDGEVISKGALNDHKCIFSSLTPNYYSLATLLEIKAPENYTIRIESHPRLYSDRTGNVPLVVPGHIGGFWPRSLFVVFKVPREGERHLFKPQEPYAQILAFQDNVNYQLQPMTVAEKIDRETLETNLTKFAWLIAHKIWVSASGVWFDDKYKRLRKIFKSKGYEKVREEINSHK